MYNIWQVSPAGYSHSSCFDEVAIALESGLKELGKKVQIVKSLFCAAPDKTIILGAHLIDPHSLVSEGAVIYNLEQIVLPLRDHYQQLVGVGKFMGVISIITGIIYAIVMVMRH